MANPQVRVTYDEGYFYVALPYSLNHLIQDLPERKFVRKNSSWKVPANWRSKEALRPLAGKAEFTDAAVKAINDIAKPKAAPQADPRMLQNFPFVHPPFGHQEEAYVKAYPQDAFALFFEQGLGKTKTAIDLSWMWHGTNQIDTVVVVCPVSIRQVWQKEFIAHTPPGSMYEVQIMNSKGEIPWSVSSDALRVLVVGVESLSQGKTWPSLQALIPSLGRIALIVDESSRVKNHKAKRTQCVVELATSCIKRLILTGTPVTQGLQDLYSQFQVLSPDTLSLTSYYAFRNRYCVVQSIPGAPPGAVKIVGYQNVDELMDLIEPWSLRKTKDECLDLPPKTYQTRFCDMAPQQRKAYKELKDNLWTEIQKESGEKDRIEVEMILEAMMRLQQITGGHYPIIWEEEKNGRIRKKSRAEPIPGANPKLNELVELMDEIQGKTIVWVRFRAELEAIVSALSKEHRVVTFHGGMSEEEKKASVHSFQEEDANVLVASYAAAYGLTLTAANTAIYFSQDFGLENYLQSQDRIHRIGQERNCTYIHLVCAGSVDEDVTEALMNKKSLADVVSERLEKGVLDSL